MSAIDIMRLIRDAKHDDDVAAAVRRHDDAFVREHYEMSETERSAVLDADVVGLTDMGVHPFSLVQLSRVLNFDLAAAWAKVQATEDGAGC